MLQWNICHVGCQRNHKGGCCKRLGRSHLLYFVIIFRHIQQYPLAPFLPMHHHPPFSISKLTHISSPFVPAKNIFSETIRTSVTGSFQTPSLFNISGSKMAGFNYLTMCEGRKLHPISSFMYPASCILILQSKLTNMLVRSLDKYFSDMY